MKTFSIYVYTNKIFMSEKAKKMRPLVSVIGSWDEETINNRKVMCSKFDYEVFGLLICP